MQADVLVIGGGSAGVAAAVAAGRYGAKTMLVERHGAMGGMASASLVHSICGLYLLREEPEAVVANPGLPGEFASRLAQAGGAWGPKRMGKVDVLLQHPTAFAWFCDRLISETPTIQPWLHTEVIDVSTSGTGEQIQSVEIATRGVRQTIEPRVVIDASGDGVAAALAGAPIEQTPGEHLQRPAFIFSLHNVNPQALDKSGRMRLAARIAKAVSTGDLPPGALGAGVRATGRAGEAFVTIDLEAGKGPRGQAAQGPRAGEDSKSDSSSAEKGQRGKGVKGQRQASGGRDMNLAPWPLDPSTPFNPTDPAWLTRLEMEGRDLAVRLSRFLHDQVTGFEDSCIAAFPTRVGVRESRRIVGQYQIDENDLLESATFDDCVGLATWPMEMRENAAGPKLRFPHEHRPCEIPLRSLRTPTIGNLLMAGRCISASHAAQASIRVIGTCLVTGEAAGLAGALQAQTLDQSPADVQAIQSARQRLFADWL